MGNGKRLLFFDLLRIVAIVGVVFYHLAQVYSLDPFKNENLVFNIFYLNTGIIGVEIFFFVSGATLEYTYSGLKGFDRILEFYAHRLIRIYPAFWISLLIAIILTPGFMIGATPSKWLQEIAGFMTMTGQWGASIHPISWFIGAIIIFYFAFPALSWVIGKRPYTMIIIIALVALTTRYLLTIGAVNIGVSGGRWFPLCNLFAFALGIFLIRIGAYPRVEYTSKELSVAAEFTFYIFLINNLPYLLEISKNSLILYLTSLFLLAWLVMLGDQRIQERLKRILDQR